jgi:hypothetical protein
MAEQALPERERAQVLLHLSRCADCREVFALAIPPATTAPPSLDTARRSWFHWPVLRWVAAGACVVIVGSAVLMKRETMMSRRETTVADSVVAVQTRDDAKSDQAPAEQALGTPAQHTSTETPEPAHEPTTPMKRLEETRSLTGASPNSGNQKKEPAERRASSPLGQTNTPTAPSTAMADAVGGPKSGAAAGIGAVVGQQISEFKTGNARVFATSPNRIPGPAAPLANTLANESNVLTGAERKDSPVAGGALTGLTVAKTGAAQAAPQKQTIEVQAGVTAVQAETAGEVRDKREIPGKAKASSNGFALDQAQAKDQTQNNETVSDTDPAEKSTLAKNAIHGSMSAYSPLSRWTISSDGQLQHSIDAGKTWQPVAVAEKVTFRALSANGPDIWAGGAAGQLYHSPDSGGHWAQVKPEFAGATLAGDIAAIEFTDIRQGKVTTANGEVWITEDGGKSWRKQS